MGIFNTVATAYRLRKKMHHLRSKYPQPWEWGENRAAEVFEEIKMTQPLPTSDDEIRELSKELGAAVMEEFRKGLDRAATIEARGPDETKGRDSSTRNAAGRLVIDPAQIERAYRETPKAMQLLKLVPAEAFTAVGVAFGTRLLISSRTLFGEEKSGAGLFSSDATSSRSTRCGAKRARAAS
jgi:hypothetical protein